MSTTSEKPDAALYLYCVRYTHRDDPGRSVSEWRVRASDRDAAIERWFEVGDDTDDWQVVSCDLVPNAPAAVPRKPESLQ